MSIKHRTIVKTGMAAALSFVIMLTMAGCPVEPEPETSGDFVAVTGISSVPVQATVGIALTLTGTVEPDNATNKTVAWTVKTGAATVSGSHLTASAAGSVVVTAAIASGASETAPFTKDFTITVYAAGTVPTVTGVTVSPKTADVQKGGPLQFTATVAGTQSPSQAVSWTVTGSSSAETSISTSGMLTVASDETLGAVLTIKAVSNADNTKSGTAEVSVIKVLLPVSLADIPNHVAGLPANTRASPHTVKLEMTNIIANNGIMGSVNQAVTNRYVILVFCN